MKSWIEYWNSDHPIYVNARHLMLHYRGIARDISDLIPEPDAVVLDFGCGEALSADLIANRCKKLFLVDSAPSIREKLTARFADTRAIHVLSPEDIANQIGKLTALPADPPDSEPSSPACSRRCARSSTSTAPATSSAP